MPLLASPAVFLFHPRKSLQVIMTESCTAGQASSGALSVNRLTELGYGRKEILMSRFKALGKGM